MSTCPVDRKFMLCRQESVVPHALRGASCYLELLRSRGAELVPKALRGNFSEGGKRFAGRTGPFLKKAVQPLF